MVILIDPPLWPAHGTTFSHLVSDDSVEELHDFARRAGLRARAFDGDHYDVPAERHDDLVLLGALPVTGGELVRRLVAGGVRIPARDRPQRARLTLVRRWDELRLGTASHRLRDELLERWSEPGRHYHDVTHLLSVLDAVDIVRASALQASVVLEPDLLQRVRLAAWFHDAVYDAAPGAPAGTDERASADLAVTALGGLGLRAEAVAEVRRLVLVTIDHSVEAEDSAGALLVDADLAVLARSEAGYANYVAAVRRDFADIPDERWRVGRAAVLRRLLATERLFTSAHAPADWEARARRNLASELDALG